MLFFRRFVLFAHIFFLSLFLFAPSVFAFEVTPSVIDVPRNYLDDFSQVITVKNLMPDTRMYEAKLHAVSLNEQGIVSGLREIPPSELYSLQPALLSLRSGEEGAFSFSLLREISEFPLGLLITEKSFSGEQVIGSFLVLFFLEPSEDAVSAVRIDALSAQPDAEHVRIVAQVSNIGDVFMKPRMLVHFSDEQGRDLGSFPFLPHGGRLPVGTTRTLSESYPLPDLGLWNLGKDVIVRFSLISLQGDVLEEAHVRYATSFGRGYFIFIAIIPVFLVGLFLFFRKKRGILSP